MYKPNKMYLVKSEPRGAALSRFQFPVVFRIVADDGGISYDVTYDESGKRTVLRDTDTDTTYDIQIEDLRNNKLDKPLTTSNENHTDVVVVDIDGNSARKPLNEFGSGGDKNLIEKISVNGEIVSIINKTAMISISTGTQTIQLGSRDNSIKITEGDITINITEYRKIFEVQNEIIFPIRITLDEDVKSVDLVTFNGIILEMSDYTINGRNITINEFSLQIFTLFAMNPGFKNKINVIGKKYISING